MNRYIQYMYSYPHKTAYRPLAGIRLKDYVALLAGGGHGLYLHIPFCEARCGYCNLFSVTGQSGEAMERYLDAVERQSGQYRQVLEPVKAVFSELVIGGGTPLLLTERQLERMFGQLERMFRFAKGREIVIETAPNQTTREKLALLKQAGVTRVSMGIQSFSDRELRAVGRRHDARRAREALGLLREAGFPRINVDFIYGIPGQTVESLLDSLREALRYEPEELFLYPLYVKHGAGLVRAGVVPDAEEAYRQYREASAFLRGEGYRQDSMRRFVRVQAQHAGEAGADGRKFSECGFGNSLALGCGGRSYLGRLHFCSPYAITQETCQRQLRAYEETEDFTDITHGFVLSDEELKRRYVIRHLLIRPGIDTGRYEEIFHGSVLADFPLLERWQEQGYLEQSCGGSGHGYVGLTEEGLGLSDYLGPQLISEEVSKAMAEWEREQDDSM